MISNPLKFIRNWLEARKLFYTLNYHGLRLKLPFNPRKGKCLACEYEGYTNIHHWLYAYTYSDVRKNNLLALNYTTETCYVCHELGNSLRKIIAEDPSMLIKASSKRIKNLLALREKALSEGEIYAKLETKTKKAPK